MVFSAILKCFPTPGQISNNRSYGRDSSSESVLPQMIRVQDSAIRISDRFTAVRRLDALRALMRRNRVLPPGAC